MRRLACGFLALLVPAGLQAQAPGKPATIGIVDSVFSPTLEEGRKFLVYSPPSYNGTTYIPKRYEDMVEKLKGASQGEGSSA